MEGKIPPPRERENIRPEEVIKIIKQEPKDTGLEQKTPAGRRSALPKGIFWGIVGLITLFLGGSFVSYYAVRGKVAGSISANLETLRSGVSDLQNLDPQSAGQKFSSLQNFSFNEFGGFVNTLGFLFRGGADAVASFSELSKQLAVLSDELGSLETGAFTFLAKGEGKDFVAKLTALRGTVGAIDAASGKLSGAASFAGGFSSLGGADFYLSLKSEVEGAKKFLDAFIPWLSDPAAHHVLVLLGNPSEIRPGGGFLGSYADVTLAGGDIKDVAVHDIADADVALKKKIVPPKPLQAIVANWRPADANWFFDYQTSAKKTVELFETSDLYKNGSTTFDAAIAVSPKVISDLLTVTGPISVGKPATTFNKDTFLVEIQKIVQKGQATSATYPKKVIGDLTEALFAKLASSTDETKQGLAGLLFDWAAKKDVMVYSKDAAMQRFFDANGASGAAYELPQKLNGDYLAVVDANIGGQKSDLYVSSTVAYSAQINPDGTLSAHLTITRKHNGVKSPYGWYKATNQDYLQVFLPPATTLVNAAGGVAKVIKAKVDYAKAGYATDPLIAAIEGTEETIFGYPAIAWHEEGGKKVFTTWSTVKAGAMNQLLFDYSHRLFLPPAEGVQYQFVFEKQAGAKRRYVFDVNAPLGYVFFENRLPSYEYVSDDPPGRVIINLTLAKLRE